MDNQTLNILIAVSGTAFGAIIGFFSHVVNNITKYKFEIIFKKLEYLYYKRDKLETSKQKLSQKEVLHVFVNYFKLLNNNYDYPSFKRNKELLVNVV